MRNLPPKAKQHQVSSKPKPPSSHRGLKRLRFALHGLVARRQSRRQPSNLVGLYKEFISSPRIDNQLSTWGAIQVWPWQVAVCWENEEVASLKITASLPLEKEIPIGTQHLLRAMLVLGRVLCWLKVKYRRLVG